MTLGLDLSDGFVRAVVVDDRAHVLGRGEQPLTGARGGEALAAPLRQALEAAGTDGKVTRAAIALPHPGDGVPADIERACRELLPKAAPILAVGIGAANVVAEQWCGAARGLTTVVALTVGEHVTSGIMLDGKVWPGAHGLAGAIGWLSLNPVEREDYRRFGGLEADVSSAGIVRRFIWRIKAGDHSAVVPSQGELARITVDQVFQGTRINDGVCVSVLKDTAKYIGMAAANLAAILDPQAIVLGGAIASWGDLLLDTIRQECGRRLSPAQADRLQILRSDLANDAAAIGAARLAHLSA
jgi:predicted NBD/HSP70 family sugar kinase